MVDAPLGTPNFSVILPGKCNCRCGFCFWKYEKSPDDWMDNLIKTIKNLPPEYKRCSISGGEPTLSPVFNSVFDIVAATRDWEAIVLTTNGTLLEKRLEAIQSINHLNLSRHHYYDEYNCEIFKTKSVPGIEELKRLVLGTNALGIDVNLNCVLVDQFAHANEVLSYIEMAKEIGVQSICFRQDQALNSTDMPKEMEWFKDIKAVGGWACASCKIYHQYILGMRVAWKAAIAEPSVATGTTYELIYHQNGVVSSDWAGKQIIDLTPVAKSNGRKPPVTQNSQGKKIIPVDVPRLIANNNARLNKILPTNVQPIDIPTCGSGSSTPSIPSCGSSISSGRCGQSSRCGW